MKVNLFLSSINPFFESYTSSDLLGKLIFLCLIFLSVACWIVLVYKTIALKRAKKNALQFQSIFLEHQKNAPLAIDLSAFPCDDAENPFVAVYRVLKKQTIALLSKSPSTQLVVSDLESIGFQLQTEISRQIKFLESQLYLLSTIVSLAPFIGLLGTVWGILITFSSLQSSLSAGSQGVLVGLSLALTTTVLGLIDAIPALIGYNYLKNHTRDFRIDMESFAATLLASIELQYRKEG